MLRFILLLLTLTFIGVLRTQTLIMNEVSQGVFGNMEYVEFVVVDNTVVYDCNATAPPSIDIRGWIFDDNSGYHGASGVAAGAVRFSFDPLWSAVPLGTIILIYNGAQPDPSIPPVDLSFADGDCRIVAPITDPALFESNATTPGAVACSYPTTGWTPGGNWNNTLLANGGDCARIVDLNGCEVFSVCYGTANLNTTIYFLDGADPSATDHRNTVYFFNDGDPAVQSNWAIGCTDNETTLDANQCGMNMQTPGLPNNVANAAYIAQFNNGCVPITPVALTALTDNNETCGCDGQATATGSGSIGPYTYEWFNASMTPIGQTGATATGLCDGTYYVEVTSSIGCQETAMITIAAGPALPTASISGGGTYCAGETISNIEVAVTGSPNWTVNYTLNGTPQTTTANSSPISLGNAPGIYVLTGVADNNCSVTTNLTETITVNPNPVISGQFTDPSGCDLSDGSILVQGAGTGNLIWSGAASGTISTSLDHSISALIAGNYTITFTDGTTGCISNTLNATLNNPPAPVLDPIANQTVCGSYDLPVITGNNLSGTQAFYDDSQANGGVAITGPVTSTQTVWVYDEGGACSDEISFNVTINPLPVADISGGGVFCNPPPGTTPVIIGVGNSGTPDYTLIYTVNGVPNTVTLQNPQNLYLGGSTGVTTYTLVSISDQNCTNNLTGSVTVEITNNYDQPIVVSGDSTYCLGDESAVMSVVANGTTNWYDISWNPLGTGSSFMPIQTLGSTTYIVQQFINNCGGLPSYITIILEPCDIIIPTAFTPDGDNVNDHWEIVDLDDLYSTNVVTVYNRWGNELYRSDEGNYSSRPWDGTYKGEPLPVGSYYFIIDLGEADAEAIRGIVSIILD